MNESAQSSPVEQALQSIVGVRSGRGPAISGTRVGPDLVLTIAHVLRGGTVTVTDDQGVHPATLAGRDPLSDLALLRVPGLTGPILTAASVPGLGAPVMAVARPAGGPMVTAGVLSGQLTGEGQQRWLLTDARPFQGFSGGALIDDAGGMVGLLNAGVSRGELLATPASVALDISGQLAVRGRVSRGRLGVSTQPVRLKGGESALLAIGVDEDGAGAAAGLLVGDVLQSWNGEALRSPGDLLGRVLGAAHQTVHLGVLRGGEEVSLAVTLGERER